MCPSIRFPPGAAVNVKDSILAAGVMLLQEQGIAALSQPRVAARAGVKQSHLTYYFPTRTDLLLGIAEQSIVAAMQNLEARLAAAPRRDTLAADISKFMIAGIPPRVIIGLIVAADADPAIRKSLRKLIRHVRRQFQALLAKAGLDAGEETALLFHATVVGLAIMHQARMSPASAREVKGGVEAMLRLLAPSRQIRTKGGA
jgi:AcrR family transcriptional regulator